MLISQAQTVSLLSFCYFGGVDRFTQIFLLCGVILTQGAFFTCNAWIRSICHDKVKELSFLVSWFWLFLKISPRHYQTQQRWWWKFLLKAALRQLNNGNCVRHWCVMLCQNFGNDPPFSVLLPFIWTVPLLKCAIGDHHLNIKIFFVKHCGGY